MESKLSLYNRQRQVRLSCRVLLLRWQLALRRIRTRGKPLPPSIELSLISSRAMAALHAEWLQVPEPTDVLSFDHGEVIVCPWVAEKEAPRHHLTTEEEVLLYGIHGFLHLGGWDDRSREDRSAMEEEQGRLFALARGASACSRPGRPPGEH